jgi:CheY-like chemotaxis protein
VPWKHWPRYDRLGRLFLDPHYLLSLATTAYEEKVFLKIGINNAANYANRWAYTYNRSERPSEQSSNYNLLPPMRKLSTEGAFRVVYSAADALSLFARWRPEIAIVDVMLPKMNGIDLALALKQQLPDCHALLLSGQPSVEALMQKAKNEGHQFETLAKPVHPTVMLEAISMLLCAEERGGFPQV